MPTVLDHIIIELELDPKKFDEGKKKAAEAFLKLQQSADDHGKKTTDAMEGMSNAVVNLGKKLLILAVSIEAVKKAIDFTQEITKTNVAIGNLAKVTGISTEELSKWDYAAERAGTSANNIRGSIMSVDRALKNITVSGGNQLTAVLGAINQRAKETGQKGVDYRDEEGRNKRATTLITDMVEAMERLKVPQDTRTAWLRSIGLDDESIAVLTSSKQRFADLLKSQDEIAKITAKDVEVANKLNEAWHRLEQTTVSLGRAITVYIADPLKAALDFATKLVQNQVERMRMDEPGYYTKHPEALEQLKSFLGPKAYDTYAKAKKLPPYDGSAPAGSELPSAARPNSYSPGGATGIVPTGTNATMKAAAGVSDEQWDAYRRGLARIESSGGNYGLMGGAGNKYAGAYQLSQEELSMAAKRLGEQRPSTQQFLGDKKMQERYLDAVTTINHERLMKNPRYAAMSTEDRLKILGYAHNQGAGGASSYLKTGKVGADAFGTPGTKYIGSIQEELNKLHNNAPVPWLSNPRLLRAPRFNQTLSATNNYATSETNVHSLIVNGAGGTKVSDDAYGLANDAVPSLARTLDIIQATQGPN